MLEFDDDLIDEIKDNIDIADFIGEYVDLQRKGRDYIGKCPFHDERTGSFTVTPHKQAYYCFGCRKGGDVITFCREYLKMSYQQAVQFLASEAGITADKKVISPTIKYLKKSARKKKIVVPEAHKILNPKIMDEFEQRRINKWEDEGIPAKIMKWYGVRYDSQRKRIVYPVYDNFGNLINIKGRTICDIKEIPKYVNYFPVGDLDYLQGLWMKKNTIKQAGEVIVFESIKSVMKLDSFGKYNSVSSETSQLNIFQVKMLIQLHCRVVIAYDSDVTLEALLTRDTIQMLMRFTDVEVVIDEEGLLGGKTAKKSPVDDGKEIWDKLYQTRIKL